MTVLDRAEKGIKEERENVWRRERKTTAGKVTKHMLKNKISLTEREKKNQCRGGSKAIKHIVRGKRRWADGVRLRADLKSCEGQCQWVRQTIAGAGLQNNKGERRADWKVALCHLPPVEKSNQVQSPSFINRREGQLIKKNTQSNTCTQQTHTHTCTDPLFFLRLSQKTQICVTVYVWVAEKRNCV